MMVDCELREMELRKKDLALSPFLALAAKLQKKSIAPNESTNCK